MLNEEVQEFKQAKKPVDQLDALLDLIYVSIGSLHKLGLSSPQMIEALQIVQDANAQKSGSKNTDGKVTKPKNFIPPEEKLQEILDSITQTDELMLVSSRQIEAVQKAKKALLEAKEPLQNEELEFFSYHIQDAIEAISSISKPYNNEEILDKMFGEFCLGK